MHSASFMSLLFLHNTSKGFNGLKHKPHFKITDGLQMDLNNWGLYYLLLRANNRLGFKHIQDNILNSPINVVNSGGQSTLNVRRKELERKKNVQVGYQLECVVLFHALL